MGQPRGFSLTYLGRLTRVRAPGANWPFFGRAVPPTSIPSARNRPLLPLLLKIPLCTPEHRPLAGHGGGARAASRTAVSSCGSLLFSRNARRCVSVLRVQVQPHVQRTLPGEDFGKQTKK